MARRPGWYTLVVKHRAAAFAVRVVPATSCTPHRDTVLVIIVDEVTGVEAHAPIVTQPALRSAFCTEPVPTVHVLHLPAAD